MGIHVSLCQEGRTVFTGLEVSQSFDLTGQLTHNCLDSIISLPILRPGKGFNTLYVQADSDERPVSLQCPVVAQSQQWARGGGLSVAVCHRAG